MTLALMPPGFVFPLAPVSMKTTNKVNVNVSVNYFLVIVLQ